MPNPYRALFAAPGAKGFSAAGFIARMPLSMTGIGIVTMLSELRGEYGLAGSVSATLALATAVIAPQISRLVDRHGQGRILLPAAGVSISALGALLLCARFDAPDWTLFLCAIPAGCTPSMGAMVRARWLEIHRGTPRLHTAFSFESVVDELCFIIGPILSIGLCVSVFPEAGPLVALAFLAIGVTAFTLQRGTEPPVHPPVHGSGGSVIRSGALRILVLTLVAVGTIFGTVDVVTVAFAEHQGNTSAASYVLAVYAGGSCLAGLTFGAVRPTTPLPRLLVQGVAVMALTMVPLLLANSIPAIAAAVFFAGMAVAPTMITTLGLVERIVPVARLTEGMTWTTTGLGLGIALGSSLSGWIVDAHGPRAGYGVAAAAGFTALVTTLAGYRHLRAAAGRRTTPVGMGGPETGTRPTPFAEGAGDRPRTPATPEGAGS